MSGLDVTTLILAVVLLLLLSAAVWTCLLFLMFIDTSTPMLDAKGHPCPEYLPRYGVHMTRKGYELWTSIVRPILEADLGTSRPDDVGQNTT